MQIGYVMKTTLDIPQDLLNEAMRSGGFPTRTATIIGALEQLIRSVRLEKLRNARGALPRFALDLDTLRSR